MEYFKDRIAYLKKIKETTDHREFINKLLDLIDDMAVMLDDCTDGVDDLEERIRQLEKTGE